MKKLGFPQRTQARVALFVIGLAVVFTGSFLLGSAFEPIETDTGKAQRSVEHGGHAAPVRR